MNKDSTGREGLQKINLCAFGIAQTKLHTKKIRIMLWKLIAKRVPKYQIWVSGYFWLVGLRERLMRCLRAPYRWKFFKEKVPQKIWHKNWFENYTICTTNPYPKLITFKNRLMRQFYCKRREILRVDESVSKSYSLIWNLSKFGNLSEHCCTNKLTSAKTGFCLKIWFFRLQKILWVHLQNFSLQFTANFDSSKFGTD